MESNRKNEKRAELFLKEIAPLISQYEMKWRSGEYYHPTLPLDKELMFQTLSKICGRKRKAKSLLQKIQKKLINMYIYW